MNGPLVTLPADLELPHARGCDRRGVRRSSTFTNADFCPSCQRFVDPQPAVQLDLEEVAS